jgi:hypothetical protein
MFRNVFAGGVGKTEQDAVQQRIKDKRKHSEHGWREKSIR